MKEEIIRKIREAGVPEQEVENFYNLLSEEVLDTIFQDLAEKLTDEGEFEWRDLGHFRVHEHKSRLFKMPDGKIVVKQQHKRVGFVAGSKLKKMV